jgi:hypothetical protein
LFFFFFLWFARLLFFSFVFQAFGVPLSSGGRLSVVSSDIRLCSSCCGFQEEAAAFLFLFFCAGRRSCWWRAIELRVGFWW